MVMGIENIFLPLSEALDNLIYEEAKNQTSSGMNEMHIEHNLNTWFLRENIPLERNLLCLNSTLEPMAFDARVSRSSFYSNFKFN